MEDKIKHKETGKDGMFFIEDEEGIIAELNYTIQDNGILVIDHTEAEERGRGKGLASKLVKKTVDYAKENDFKIDPVCEYAKKQFDRHEEYQELLAE